MNKKVKEMISMADVISARFIGKSGCYAVVYTLDDGDIGIDYYNSLKAVSVALENAYDFTDHKRVIKIK